MRLFVALALPAEVRTELATWARAQAALRDGLRSLSADSLHLTLCFLGSCPASWGPAISDACRTVAGLPAPSLKLGDPIWLPARRPRVLAIGLTEPDGADANGRLAGLQSALAAALARAGAYEPERRRFLAHVTVARAGAHSRVRAVDLPAPAPRPPFRAASVVLYRSHLGAGGARYEALTTVELRR